VADVAVESDRVVVRTVHERIEEGRETCQERSPSDSWPAWSVGIVLSLPVEADRPLAVVERDGTTWSNRYRVTLEPVDNDEVIFANADGVPAGDVPAIEDLDPAAREAILAAIGDGRWEIAEVSAVLACVLAEYRFVRNGEAFYELDATVPTYRVLQESAPQQNVTDDAAVVSLDSTESAAVEQLFVETVMDGPVETPYLPPAFRRIIENNDYVRWRERYHELTVERVDPGPAYVLRVDTGVSPHAEVNRVSYRSPETDRIRITDAVGTADKQFETAPRP
jgi:hypothetical protein